MPNLQTIDILEFGQDIFSPLAKLIIREYGFKDIKEISYPAVHSFTSKKVIFSANNGKQNKKYFLKEKPEYAKGDIPMKLGFLLQDYLSSKDKAIPEVVKTKKGNNFLKICDRIFFITPYIDGIYYRGKKDEIYQAGIKLGEIHRLSSKINDLHDLKIEKSLTTEISRNFLELAEKHVVNKNSQFEEIVNCIKNYLDSVESKLKNFSDNHFILGHGDYSPFNLVFDRKKNNVIAVNDFDNVGLLLKTHDLAEAIITFSYMPYRGCSSNFSSILPNRVDFNIVNTLLKGYQSVQAIEKNEFKILDKIIMSIWVELVCLGIIRDDFNFEVIFDFQKIREQVEKYVKNI